MIEVRLFATLREGRGKTAMLEAASVRSAGDALAALGIAPGEVAILLINGFHAEPGAAVGEGDVLALFPPVGGG